MSVNTIAQRSIPGSGLAFEDVLATGRRQPEATAVCDDARSLSFGALLELSGRIANALRARGARPGGRILLVADKSPAGIACVFGIQRAGCAYAPVDPGWPKDRVRRIWEDLRPDAVLTEHANLPLLIGAAPRAGAAWSGLVIDGDPYIDDLVDLGGRASLEASSPDAAAPPIDGDAMAYILFTSGSSGTPKGVEIRHRNLAALCAWMRPALGLTRADRVVNPAPLTFDYSVQDLFVALAAGATLELLPRAGLPGDLLARLRSRKVTAMTGVPSFFCYLSRLRSHDFPDALASVRLVQFCGEPFPLGELRYWMRALPRAAFYNAYGPTEATVIVSQRRLIDIPDAPVLPIGVAAPGSRMRIVRGDGTDAAVDETGEIWIGGAQVAAGYLNDPGATARVFVEPAPGEPVRFYRTGDLGRRTSSGELVCLGRQDRQIKLHGRRIDLTEIELALCSLDHVGSAVVQALSGDDGRVAEIRARVETSATEARVRDDLRALLPEYMIPRIIERIDQLPRNPAGKLERGALT